MHPAVHPPPDLTDPPALLAIARAANLIGDRDLERAARRLLRDSYGIEVRFHSAEPSRRQEVGYGDPSSPVA
jgi:hypothetical protein